jgi:2-octaprenyl-6-methoxyphenol hydroxylase
MPVIEMTRTDQSMAERRAVSQGCAVIGGGPAALIAALALAHFKVPATLVARRPAGIDNRTTALLAGSIAALEALGVWDACRPHAAPLRVMRIADDTRRLWRAPEVRFEADEIGLPAFGWNIENARLVAALWDRVGATDTVVHVDSTARSIEIGDAGVAVTPADGASFVVALAIGADGRRSLCRDAAGIAVSERTTPQTALTYIMSHSRPHYDISTEFHTEHGPFTVVPLPGNRSSVVCVVAPREAERLAQLSGPELNAEIERRCHSILGKIEVEPGHAAFPLMVATAERAAAHRIALVGEAAHVFPPIGAQGLNLGLRDAVTIAEVAGAVAPGADRGGDAVTAEYERRRRTDIGGRILAVDILNRSLLSDLLPVQGLRGIGLYALDRVGILRRALMREGVAPSAATPALMRPSDAAATAVTQTRP